MNTLPVIHCIYKKGPKVDGWKQHVKPLIHGYSVSFLISSDVYKYLKKLLKLLEIYTIFILKLH